MPAQWKMKSLEYGHFKDEVYGATLLQCNLIVSFYFFPSQLDGVVAIKWAAIEALENKGYFFKSDV